jgi:hypothetical protein
MKSILKSQSPYRKETLGLVSEGAAATRIGVPTSTLQKLA